MTSYSQDQKIVISGASRGIGKAIAGKIVQEGGSTIELARQLESFDGEPEWPDRQVRIAMDLEDKASLRNGLGTIRMQAPLHGCVCNAGINLTGDIEGYSSQDLEVMLQVNLQSAMQLAQSCAEQMIKDETRGTIVFVSSIWGERSRPGRSVYSATKAGLLGFMRGLAVDLAPHGIRVNAVSPGFTETELTARTNTPEQIRHLAESVPMRRLAQPLEIAEVVSFLLSHASSYITGQNLVVDGGFSIV